MSSHIFRHTLISRLAENNIPLRAIMDKVGHSYPKTTNAIYTHATENMNNNLMAILEKY
ncbi:tyrosine-type recombinase/integrase [Streptococcus mitis]|nr:tyrosine-type recombinase/integrase [Streptococcus sp. NLN76]MBG9367680.1 tyrosine-type recombinase/integrase [Streptococcus sp. NLN64]